MALDANRSEGKVQSPADQSGLSVLLARVARAAFDEVQFLNVREALVEEATRHLPNQAFCRVRTALWRSAGVRIGKQSQIQGSMRITGPREACSLVSLGAFTMITGGLHIDAGAPVTIGDDVRIGHDVSLLTIGHAIGPASFRAGTRSFAPIQIEDGCWIASRVTILPGVRVGKGSIVAAGAVVSRDVPPNTLVAGVPARVLRELPVDG